MKRIKILLSFIVCVLSLALLCSCAPDITIDEVREVLPSLVDESKPLNEIYFGEGFEIDGDVSDVESSGGYYCCDTEEYGLNSILEIKEATEKVFTKEYSEILYEAAFEGLSTDTMVKAPRFIEGEDGLMEKANDNKYQLLSREFDYDSVVITKKGNKRVTLSVDTYVDGKKADTLTIILVRQGDEGNYIYRLDSPTY